MQGWDQSGPSETQNHSPLGRATGKEQRATQSGHIHNGDAEVHRLFALHPRDRAFSPWVYDKGRRQFEPANIYLVRLIEMGGV
jgi:hypothetical protein